MVKSIEDLVGFKIEVFVEQTKGFATVESFVLFSQNTSIDGKDNLWVELYMGIQGAARKESVIELTQTGDIHDHKALKELARELALEYSEPVANELINLLPDPEEVCKEEYDIIELTDE